MSAGDFRHNEKSVTVPAATTVRIEHVAKDGSKTVLKDGLALLAGEIIDGTYMSKKALVSFLREQVGSSVWISQKSWLFDAKSDAVITDKVWTDIWVSTRHLVERQIGRVWVLAVWKRGLAAVSGAASAPGGFSAAGFRIWRSGRRMWDCGPGLGNRER